MLKSQKDQTVLYIQISHAAFKINLQEIECRELLLILKTFIKLMSSCSEKG